MKKYIIALGGLGTIVTPLVSVISCTKKDDKSTNKVVVKQIDFATDKVLSYLQDKKTVLSDALQTAREDSNNAKELKANLVANISSGNISSGMRVTFDDKLAAFATPKVVEGIVEKNLKLIAPTGSLKRKGTYGISWVKGDKVIIKNQELGYVIANKGFFNKLDTAMKLKGKITLAIDSFSKMGDTEKIIPKLISLKILKGKMGDALNLLKNLDFTVKDFKDIISSVKMIVHNIDADLPTIMASNHKLSSLLKLAKTPNVILNKKEFYEGVSTLINKFADLVLRNKTKVGGVIKAVNLFKPGLISETKSKLISAVVESKFFEKFVTNLKAIKPAKVEALGKIILSIVKNNDFKNFNIMKFITKKGNIQNVTELFNTLGISYEDMIKAVIDNFDKIKPLIGFLQPTPKKDEDGKVVIKDGKVVMEDKYELVDTKHIYKLIELLKKESGVDSKDSNDQIIEKLSKLSLSNLIDSIIKSKILSKWFISTDFGELNFFEDKDAPGAQMGSMVLGLITGEFFGSDDTGRDDDGKINGSTMGVYFKPILSFEFLHTLENFMTSTIGNLGFAPISKLPANIKLKLNKFFSYLNTLKTPEQKKAFSKNLQGGMQNILKLLLKKNSSSEITKICSKISKNKTISVLLNLLK